MVLAGRWTVVYSRRVAQPAEMEELQAGLFHWSAVHPRIHFLVSSYWLDGAGVAIDPLLDGDVTVDWFAARPTEPAAVLLSNRHHYRSSGALQQRFGCAVYCSDAGLHEFTRGEQVEGFAFTATLPGPAVACEVGAICPDETALYLERHGALLFADAVVRGGSGVLGFVPDELMDDPPNTKAGILASCRRILDDPRIAFRHLLLAHGGPVMDDGRALLEELVDSGGRTAFEF